MHAWTKLYGATWRVSGDERPLSLRESELKSNAVMSIPSDARSHSLVPAEFVVKFISVTFLQFFHQSDRSPATCFN